MFLRPAVNQAPLAQASGRSPTGSSHQASRALTSRTRVLVVDGTHKGRRGTIVEASGPGEFWVALPHPEGEINVPRRHLEAV